MSHKHIKYKEVCMKFGSIEDAKLFMETRSVSEKLKYRRDGKKVWWLKKVK